MDLLQPEELVAAVAAAVAAVIAVVGDVDAHELALDLPDQKHFVLAHRQSISSN